MDIAVLARSVSVFLFFAVALALNFEDNVVARLGMEIIVQPHPRAAIEAAARLGMEGNYALVFSMSVLFTLLIVDRNVFVVAAVVCLCLIANLPADFGLNFGYDRDFFTGLMLALLFQPVLERVLA